MPGVGKLEPFDVGTTSWDEYQERVEQFFIANDVEDEKKRAVLLTCLGPATYSLLRNLLSPSKPSETSLSTILDELKKHFSPRPSAVVATFKFDSRIRHSGETAGDFFASLNKLADDCAFGTFRDRMLRDRIVPGINDQETQRRLLESPDVTLDTAKTLGSNVEREPPRSADKVAAFSAYRLSQAHPSDIFDVRESPRSAVDPSAGHVRPHAPVGAAAQLFSLPFTGPIRSVVH
ncbi:hypothetical protein HPB49_026224 [Dermacentor silvarum]|nr:hypothetical protein HPB49_026224 [Dermacentor silvarum]